MSQQNPSYIEQMTALRDATAQLATQFGLPNSRSLIIRTRSIEETLRYMEIQPTPIITELRLASQTLEGASSISGAFKTFDVKGVSRRYSRSQLEQDAVEYIIGAQLRLGKLVGGILCQLESLKENPTTWDLVLVQKIAEQSIY